MGYISVKEAAVRWGITERVVRQYCADGRVPGAFAEGRAWAIPDDAGKPGRKPRARKIPDDPAGRLLFEMKEGVTGGLYHRVQIDLTYNSNHIEGSRLTQDQTRRIFETNTIDAPEGSANVDDVIETVNHFRCVDLIIAQAGRPITETMIRQLHLILKTGTSDSRKGWFAVGGYKRLPNEVAGLETVPPERVGKEMAGLLSQYRKIKDPDLDDLLDFHYRFERIHPFQDGNGRVGRLILFKECLRCGIVPFIIEDDLKMFYYRGLAEWPGERGNLRETCRTAQERFKTIMDYHRVKY